MAQTQKAKEQEKNQNQTQLEENRQTQTPPSRQAGANQPQGMTRRGGSQEQRGLSRQGQFAPVSPFSFLRRFSEEMDRLFEDFGFGGNLMSPNFGNFETAMWSPQTEIFRRGNELVVQADLPGMSKDDINVDIEDNQIIIRGERRSERESDEEGSYYTERSYGSFYRSIPLPEDIDTEQAEANFRDGVLEITMPLPEQKSRGKRLEIGEGKGKSQSKSNKQTKSEEG